jgi:hypothetical protein
MAYIRKEQVQEIRNALKKQFPNLKLSVKKNSYSSTLVVTVLKGDVDFFNEINKERFSNDPTSQGYIDVNPYWFRDHFKGQSLEILEAMEKTIKTLGNWFDHSDSMTDYFHTAFYIDYNIGTWEKPYEKVA